MLEQDMQRRGAFQADRGGLEVGRVDLNAECSRRDGEGTIGGRGGEDLALIIQQLRSGDWLVAGVDQGAGERRGWLLGTTARGRENQDPGQENKNAAVVGMKSQFRALG